MESDCTGDRIAMQFNTASQNKNRAGSCLSDSSESIDTIP
jgi:hypothetical protein